jgi:hypothetical protein
MQKVAIEYEGIIQAMVGFHLAIYPGGEVGVWIIIAVAKWSSAVASTLRLQGKKLLESFVDQATLFVENIGLYQDRGQLGRFVEAWRSVRRRHR